MGRKKYTEKERSQIMISFLRATREVIDTEGLEQVSIRKIADRTEMNSATLYLYFSNVNVLITMALLSYLENYCRTLADDNQKMKTPEDVLMHTWDVFCRYAVENPAVFYHIFYADHTATLTDIVDEYYRLFPEHLQDIEGPVLDMLREGSLTERSWKVFWPVAGARGISEENARMANDMLVAYFRALLEARQKNPETAQDSARLSADMKRALEFLLT